MEMLSNSVSISLLGYFLILHIRLERAAKISQEQFPSRWAAMKHRCLFAVRFSILTLLFHTAYSFSGIYYPEVIEILRYARNGMFFCLIFGFSLWIQDSIRWMITGRVSDKRQPDPHKDLLG